jgi:hypothetical protein
MLLNNESLESRTPRLWTVSVTIIALVLVGVVAAVSLVPRAVADENPNVAKTSASDDKKNESIVAVPEATVAAKSPQSDQLNSTKPASAKLEKATETSVSTSEALAETPLKIVQQATINAWKGLVSGKGRGTCTYKLKDKPDTKFDFEIAFDGDKFNFVMTEGSTGVNDSRRFHSNIAVSDGSAMLVREFEHDLQHGERTAYIRSPRFLSLRSMAFLPLIDLPRNTRTALDPKGFDTFSIQIQKMPDGRLHGTYDLNKFVRGEFDATKESGYNVSRGEVFNKEGSRTGTIFTSEWKREKNVWYVAAMTREDWRSRGRMTTTIAASS